MKNHALVLLSFFLWHLSFSATPLYCQTISDTAGCNNFSGYTDADSLFGINYFAKYQTIESDLSPDGRFLATYMLNVNYPEWNDLYDGSVIIDPQTQRIVKHLGSYRPRWSLDGKRILLLDYIYDIESDSIIEFPSEPRSLWDPRWSVNGKSVLFSLNSGGPLLRFDIDNRTSNYIPFVAWAKPLTDSTLFYIPNNFRNSDDLYYVLYNINTGVRDTIDTPELGPSAGFDGVRDIFNIAVSKKARFFAADFRLYGHPGVDAGRGVLGMYDFNTHRFKELASPQPFHGMYYPTWSSDSTLIISMICHSDTSYTAWEIDTSGVLLRQLTNKHILPGTSVGIKALPEISDLPTMELFPQPAKNAVVIECSLKSTALYTLTIFTMLGKEVAKLWDNRFLSPGVHSVSFSSVQLAGDIYFIRLSSFGKQPVIKKLSFLK